MWVRSLLVVVTVVASLSAGMASPVGSAPAYSVSLTASPTTLEVGEAATLTVTVNADLTGTRFTTYVFDQTNTNWYRTCKVQSCTFSVTQNDPGTRTYVAYVARDRADPRYPPMQVQATSDPVSVTWTAVTYTITLVADETWLVPGATAGLTAEANRDVGPRGFAIQIFDLVSGQRVALCTTGTTCNAFVREVTPTTRTYQAFVAETGDAAPPPNVQASSNVLAVTWSPLPDPSQPPNIGGGDLTGTMNWTEPGLPELDAECVSTSFSFDGASLSAWVNTSGAAYAGPLSVSATGGSNCERFSTGIGTITISATGTSPVGTLVCEGLTGGYTRVAMDISIIVSGSCSINGFTTVGVTFVAKGELVPTNAGGGLTAPVTAAMLAGGFAVVPL